MGSAVPSPPPGQGARAGSGVSHAGEDGPPTLVGLGTRTPDLGPEGNLGRPSPTFPLNREACDLTSKIRQGLP
jgi:hypothetical protein